MLIIMRDHGPRQRGDSWAGAALIAAFGLFVLFLALPLEGPKIPEEERAKVIGRVEWVRSRNKAGIDFKLKGHDAVFNYRPDRRTSKTIRAALSSDAANTLQVQYRNVPLGFSFTRGPSETYTMLGLEANGRDVYTEADYRDDLRRNGRIGVGLGVFGLLGGLYIAIRQWRRR